MKENGNTISGGYSNPGWESLSLDDQKAKKTEADLFKEQIEAFRKAQEQARKKELEVKRTDPKTDLIQTKPQNQQKEEVNFQLVGDPYTTNFTLVDKPQTTNFVLVDKPQKNHTSESYQAPTSQPKSKQPTFEFTTIDAPDSATLGNITTSDTPEDKNPTEADMLAKEEADQQAKEHQDQVAKYHEFMERQQTEQQLRKAVESEHATNAEELSDVEQQTRKAVEDEYAANDEELADIERRLAENPDRLVAINADWTHDKRELAHDLAEQDLNTEVSKANIIKKIWKGNLFKKYYEKKYEKEYMEGKRTDDKGRTLKDIIAEQHQDVMERFVLGATEDMRYIHEKIGKKKKDNSYDGEKLIKADSKTNEQIKSAIEKYARATLEPGEKVSDLDRNFENEVDRIIAEAIDNNRLGKGWKDNSTNNILETAKKAAGRYKEVAKNAKNKAEQDFAMAQVMAGFQLYNADVRNNVRTDAHRDAIDKIVNKLESSALGQFIPAEILAGAAGAAMGLTQTGARAIAGAAGGVIASSLISGLRERNRITEDRARMLRDIANGMDYSGRGKEAKGLRGQEKYEARIGDTLYDNKKATDLINMIEEATIFAGKYGDANRLLQAIAEARVRIDLSDSEQKDLISYSSSDNRGKERLKLDKLVINAEKKLGEINSEEAKDAKKSLEAMKNEIKKRIIDGYEDESGEHHAGIKEKDQNFKNFRTIAAMKRAGKTLALGTAIFFGSQEVMAAIDPSKIGLFEKFGLIKTQNEVNAKETLLASGFGRFRGEYEMPNGATNSSGPVRTSDPEQMSKLEAAGYKKTEIQKAWSESREVLKDVDPSESSARVDVKYDGWANNGTKISDGNELRAHIENGQFISTMRGASTFNGQRIEYDPSRIKAYLTIGDSKFEIAGKLNESGQLTWGDNGVFTTTTGETIKAIGDNGEKLYRYFEIAAVNDVKDGVQHIIPFATDVGTNSFSGKIQQVVTDVIEHPAEYVFTKDIPVTETFIRDVSYNGLGFAPDIFARTGLGEATATPVTESSTEIAPTTLNNLPPINGAANGISVTPAPEGLPDNYATVVNNDIPELPNQQPEPLGIEDKQQTDSERWENEIRDEIEQNANIIGGQEGVNIITGRDVIGDVNSERRFAEWWNTLDDAGKRFVRDIVGKINASGYSRDVDWGRGFRTWLALNPETPNN